MNKKLNPILAISIVGVFGVILFLKFYFYRVALDVPRVSYVKKSPTGNVFIRLGNQLYAYSMNGVLQETVDLRRLGYSDGMKDFDFFSDGEILINRDDFLPSFTDRLNSYLRKTNTETAAAEFGKGLQRCNLSSMTCRVFNEEIPAIQGTHFITINRVNDEVFLADTGRHQIRKFDSSGKLLSEITEGLKFPNQILSEGDKLWIVDTNNHVMKSVKSETNVFGELIEEHEVKLEDPWIWPSSFSKVGDNWWIHVSQNNMSHAKVVILDKHWGKIKTLRSAENSDFVLSQVLDKAVLVSDFDDFSLHQYDFNGKRIADFAVDESDLGIQQVLKENKQKDQKFRFWSDFITWFGITLFVCIFAYALYHALIEYREKKAKQKELDGILGDPERRDEFLAAQLTTLPVGGEWIEAIDKLKKLKRNITLIVVLSVVIGFYFYYEANDDGLDLLIKLSLLTSVLLIATIPIMRISQYKIGFYQNKITLKTHTGIMLSETYENIKWGTRGFVIQDWYVPIGTKRNHMFPFDKLKERLLPYLSETNKMGEVEALKFQWKSPESSLKYMCLALIIGFFLIYYL